MDWNVTDYNDYPQNSDPLFPPDLFDPDQLRRGWILLYLVGVIYLIVSMGFLTSEFFTPSLITLINKLKISQDVGGAMVLALGVSVPGLITSIIGIFVAYHPVGIGTIVGSSVYNVLFVVGVSALFSKHALKLTWWPLLRDLTFYSLGLVVLILFFIDNYVRIWEAALLVLLYVLYFITLVLNKKIKGLFAKKNNTADGDQVDIKEGKPLSLFSMPETCCQRFLHIIRFPFVLPFWLTLPDPRKESSRKFFFLTYLGCIIWMLPMTYLLVWWSTIVGNTFGIPPEVMGLTLMGFGTTMPYLVSSVIVARKGCGDMVISAAHGINIFTITVGLPLPMFLFSLIFATPFIVDSDGIACSVTLLFAMLAIAFGFILCCKLRLNKGLGFLFILLHLLFILVSITFTYEIIQCPISF